jgi:flagellar basal body-associated protein FliL
MGRSLVVAILALVGLLCAAGMGYAAYVVSRGSVAVPVTRLQRTPAQQLTPAGVRARVRTHSRPIEQTRTVTTPTPTPTTTVDDHGGRSPGGSGSDSGGGGHGSDD